MKPPTNRRFAAPASVVRLKGRTIATYGTAAFIPARLAHRRPPLVVSLLLSLLCALVLCLICALLMHPVNGEKSTTPDAQTGTTLSALVEEYDP